MWTYNEILKETWKTNECPRAYNIIALHELSLKITADLFIYFTKLCLKK